MPLPPAGTWSAQPSDRVWAAWSPRCRPGEGTAALRVLFPSGMEPGLNGIRGEGRLKRWHPAGFAVLSPRILPAAGIPVHELSFLIPVIGARCRAHSKAGLVAFQAFLFAQPRCGAGLGRIVPNGTFPSAGAPPQRHSLPGREGARCVCRGHRAERREILRATPVRAPGCGERFGAALCLLALGQDVNLQGDVPLRLLLGFIFFLSWFISPSPARGADFSPCPGLFPHL